ncbi:hypothetical protein KU43P_51330 [Pseudomonas sp. KU43P]|nr:hypothetical protein KU43P_51330 [Pseudomonas sp. KU43P]
MIVAACLAALAVAWSAPYENSQSYRSEGHHFMGDDTLDFKERLTISEPSAVISLLERQGEKERHIAVGASLVERSRWRVTFKVEDIQASNEEQLFNVSRHSELLFSRQYFRLGSILNLAVIPVRGDALCYYILELDRLRCMNN